MSDRRAARAVVSQEPGFLPLEAHLAALKGLFFVVQATSQELLVCADTAAMAVPAALKVVGATLRSRSSTKGRADRSGLVDL